MTEYEAYDLAVQLVGLAHELGEATHARIEFWSGISYGLLALAYLAPERLTTVISTYLLILYTAFTINVAQNIGFDIDTATAARRDALLLTQEYDVPMKTAAEKARPDSDPGFDLVRSTTSLYFPGLYLATVGFLGITCYEQRKKGKEPR